MAGTRKNSAQQQKDQHRNQLRKSVGQLKKLGTLVKTYRLRMKLSINELGELANISSDEIEELEKGAGASMALHKLYALSNCLNIPPSALLASIEE